MSAPTHIRLGATLAAALLALAGAAPLATAKKSDTFKATKKTNAGIPDRPTASGPFGVLTSTIKAGNSFKGRRIRDVNLTIQTAGAFGTTPATDLTAHLVAPNGAIVHQLFQGLGTAGPTATSIGPLTLDDEAPLRLAAGDLPGGLLPNILYAPWVGSAEPMSNALTVMDDGPVKGKWTLAVIDTTNGEASNLVSWRLQVKTGEPYREK